MAVAVYDNSKRLTNSCQGVELRLAGSWFKHKNFHRLNWFSTDDKTAKETDHIQVQDTTHSARNLGFLFDDTHVA